MAIYKVTINKDRTGNGTKFSYPSGYVAKNFNPFLYENKGNNTEHCLAVGDNGLETTGIELIDTTTAETLIEDYINNDKDFVMPADYEGTESEYKTELINKKKALL